MNGDERQDSLSERIDRFHRLLDELESHLDSGFFLSLIGKIVIDEKKIYTVLSELRSLRFDLKQESAKKENPAVAAPKSPIAALEGVGDAGGADARKAKLPSAESIRRGADEYAAETLDNLDQTLQKMMVTIRDGKSYLKQRLAQEVSKDATTEI